MPGPVGVSWVPVLHVPVSGVSPSPPRLGSPDTLLGLETAGPVRSDLSRLVGLGWWLRGPWMVVGVC